MPLRSFCFKSLLHDQYNLLSCTQRFFFSFWRTGKFPEKFNKIDGNQSMFMFFVVFAHFLPILIIANWEIFVWIGKFPGSNREIYKLSPLGIPWYKSGAYQLDCSENSPQNIQRGQSSNQYGQAAHVSVWIGLGYFDPAPYRNWSNLMQDHTPLYKL